MYTKPSDRYTIFYTTAPVLPPSSVSSAIITSGGINVVLPASLARATQYSVTVGTNTATLAQTDLDSSPSYQVFVASNTTFSQGELVTAQVDATARLANGVNATTSGSFNTTADIDECIMGTHNCSTNASCNNTNGGFICSCNTGYTGDGVTCTDIDECTSGTHNCHTNANCTNINGSFTCACKTGFTGDGVSCTDIDECTLGTHNCHANANCTNTIGSFTCACNTGFTGDGVNCTDINECTLGTHNCDTNANCTNTIGSFTCACKPGFSGDGVSCTDISPCTLGTHNCDTNANCTNTIGSFTCACKTGFTGDGVNCTDINECTLGTHNCDTNANCTNTIGSFTCACQTGFTGDGVNCTDISPCTLGTHNCDTNANCTNTIGSFTCACKTGFTGDGVNCTDINECTLGTHNCDTNANCTNTIGSFTCTCNTGFTGDGVSCSDIHPCELATHNCHANANCTNTVGSFTCVCKTGFTGDGVTCADIDECALNTDNCDTNANSLVVPLLRATDVTENNFIISWNSHSEIISHSLFIFTNGVLHLLLNPLSSTVNLNNTLNGGTQYCFNMTSTYSDGQIVSSLTVCQFTVPNIVEGLFIIEYGTTFISIGWDATVGADKYVIEVMDDTPSSRKRRQITTPATFNVTGQTNTTISNLAPGRKYTISIAARNAGGTSQQRSKISITTTTPPPQELKVEFYDGLSANISWTASAGTSFYNITFVANNTEATTTTSNTTVILHFPRNLVLEYWFKCVTELHCLPAVLQPRFSLQCKFNYISGTDTRFLFKSNT
ncbi:uncharacterized protein LOC144745535 [Ciona intestinalis]